jgi:hypothetical protein
LTSQAAYEFEVPPAADPLFSFEAVFKTTKRYFHDMKQLCLSRREYDEAAPLYFYGVPRGSAIWQWLGELRQLILFGTTHGGFRWWHRKLSQVLNTFADESGESFATARAIRPGRDAIRRYSESDVVIRLAFLEVAEDNTPYFSRCNSGAIRMQHGKPVSRGPKTFVEALDSDFPPSKVVEVTFVELVKLPPGGEVVIFSWHNASQILNVLRPNRRRCSMHTAQQTDSPF